MVNVLLAYGTSLLTGIVLGTYFRVWILVPTSMLAALGSTVLLWGMDLAWPLKLVCGFVSVLTLQLGYVVGSTFALSARTGREAEQDGSEAGRGMRVLVAEDDTVLAMELEELLSRAGYTVVDVAASGSKAVQAAVEKRPDIVIMDIGLAGQTDGIAAAAEIRKRLGVRSIFLTAHNDPGTRARVQDIEPVDFISKPYQRSRLLQVLQTANAA